MADQEILKIRVVLGVLLVINLINVAYLGTILNYWLFSRWLGPSIGNTLFGLSFVLMSALVLGLSLIIWFRATGRTQRTFVVVTAIGAGVLVVMSVGWFLISPTAAIYLLFAGGLFFMNTVISGPLVRRESSK